MQKKQPDRVYIFQCNEFVKIGVSKNPSNRLASLQTGNPYKIKTLLSIQSKNAYAQEKDFHKFFDSKRGIGEWFKIDEDIKNFVKYLKLLEYREMGGEY